MKMVMIYVGVAFGTTILTMVFLFLFCPDVFFNGYIKNKIEKGFSVHNSELHLRIHSLYYHFWDNKVDFDTINITNNNSDLIYQVIGCSISGIRLSHLMNGGPTVNEISGYNADSKMIYIHNSESKYKLRMRSIHLSASDSTIIAEGFEYFPVNNDETFFAANEFRQTRCDIYVPEIKLSGIDYAGFMKGKNPAIHSVILKDLSMNILLNKEKPFELDTVINPMPNEIFNKIKNPFLIDNITVDNGYLNYNERFNLYGKPATLEFNHIKISANEIVDTINKSTTELIAANGIFNNTTKMDLLISVPLTSVVFSMKYSGAFDRMDLLSLNHYLNNAEEMRVKSGVLTSAIFAVDITSGYASGNVNAVYSDLKLEPSELKTNKTKVGRNIKSFMANTFVIHKNNLPDKAGNVKPGKIKYMRRNDTAFIEMIWLSLRTGIADVTGI